MRFQILIFLALAALNSSIQSGSIHGRVVDADGKPVAKAKLHLAPAKGMQTGRVIFYWSCNDGTFVIDGLAPGAYDVFVSKEDEDYADTQMFLYSVNGYQPARVVVSDQPGGDVTVRLGPKAGRITGDVRDARNGAPIRDAIITFRRPENEKMFLQTSLNMIDSPGSFDFLVPAAPTAMKVTAPGYEDWTYQAPHGGQDTDLLTLVPGQKLYLSIKMNPIKR